MVISALRNRSITQNLLITCAIAFYVWLPSRLSNTCDSERVHIRAEPVITFTAISHCFSIYWFVLYIIVGILHFGMSGAYHGYNK